jgi:hypothetical protein
VPNELASLHVNSMLGCLRSVSGLKDHSFDLEAVRSLRFVSPEQALDDGELHAVEHGEPGGFVARIDLQQIGKELWIRPWQKCQRHGPQGGSFLVLGAGS